MKLSSNRSAISSVNAKRGAVVCALVVTAGVAWVIGARASGVPTAGPVFYAGVLEENGAPVNGTRNIHISFQNSGNSASCDLIGGIATEVVDGHFSVDVSSCVPFFRAHSDVDAKILVEGTTLALQPVGAVPFALEADHATTADSASTVANGSVTSASIADGAVAAADLAGNSVDGSKIADGSVAAADLAANSVDGSKIVNGSVAAADLAGSSVDSAAIADGSIAGVDLAGNCVDGLKILDGSVGNADLANNSVDSSKIANASIQNADLGGGSVDSLTIADGSVGAVDLAGNCVDSSKIADGQVTTADLANASVDPAKLVRGAAGANLEVRFETSVAACPLDGVTKFRNCQCAPGETAIGGIAARVAGHMNVFEPVAPRGWLIGCQDNANVAVDCGDQFGVVCVRSGP